MSDLNFEDWGKRMIESARERNAALTTFLATQPQMRPCAKHADETRAISLEASQRATLDAGRHVAGYTSCLKCQQERKAAEETEHLTRSGVPSNLTHCTFQNWNPRSDEDAAHLETVKAFAEQRTGFLVMLGPVGTGKTHLAVSAMRGFRSALLVKQSTLLRNLRDTYRDKKAIEPVDQCQAVGLLALDEMGMSPGGRDELPMLHEILDYRHGERKPTILTGNLGWEELKAVTGDRMADRLKESSFAVLNFAGSSHRRDARQRYFED